MNPGIHILVIDDDAMVRDVLCEYLSTFGFVNVTEATTASRALKMIHDQKIQIDLVLSDWEMPEHNGLTMLKAVRNSPHRKDTKFIMITSQKSMERMKITQAANGRVNSYIVKPFRARILRDKIWKAMGWEDESQADSA